MVDIEHDPGTRLRQNRPPKCESGKRQRLDPLADQSRTVALEREWQEICRGDPAFHGVMPAGKYSMCKHSAIIDRDDGLQGNRELVSLDRTTQRIALAQWLQPRAHPCGAVKPDRSPVRPGLNESRIGALQELLGIAAVVRVNTDVHTRADADASVAKTDGVGRHGAHPRCDIAAFSHRGDILGHDDKFIATDIGKRFRMPCGIGEPGREAAQAVIELRPREVRALRVESLQIDIQQGNPAAIAVSRADGALDTGLCERAVRQPGEIIVIRGLIAALFTITGLGDIVRDSEPIDRFPACMRQRQQIHRVPEWPAGAGVVQQFDLTRPATLKGAPHAFAFT